MKKQILSIMTVFAMIFTLLQTTVFATGGQVAKTKSAPTITVGDMAVDTGKYYKNDGSGGLTENGASENDYNVYYIADDVVPTLILNDADVCNIIIKANDDDKIAIKTTGESIVTGKSGGNYTGIAVTDSYESSCPANIELTFTGSGNLTIDNGKISLDGGAGNIVTVAQGASVIINNGRVSACSSGGVNGTVKVNGNLTTNDTEIYTGQVEISGILTVRVLGLLLNGINDGSNISLANTLVVKASGKFDADCTGVPINIIGSSSADWSNPIVLPEGYLGTGVSIQIVTDNSGYNYCSIAKDGELKFEDSQLIGALGKIEISNIPYPSIEKPEEPEQPEQPDTEKPNTDDNNSGSSSSGNSSSSNEKTEVIKNPDGSITTIVTHPDGSKTETTKYPDGFSQTTITKFDGSGSVTVIDANGNIISHATLFLTAIKTAQQAGILVLLPMSALSVTNSLENAPTITVDLPDGVTSAKA